MSGQCCCTSCGVW